MATLVAEGLCLPGGRPPGAPTALVAVGGSLCCGRGAEHDVHGWGAAVTLVTEAGWPPSWPKVNLDAWVPVARAPWVPCQVAVAAEADGAGEADASKARTGDPAEDTGATRCHAGSRPGRRAHAERARCRGRAGGHHRRARPDRGARDRRRGCHPLLQGLPRLPGHHLHV